MKCTLQPTTKLPTTGQASKLDASLCKGSDYVEMKPRPSLLLLRCISFAFFITATRVGKSAPVMLNTNLQIRLVMNTTNSSGQNSVRIAKDPRNNQLYYLKINGDIFRVNLQPPGSASTSTKVYSATDHGLSSSVEGLAIGPDGTIYVLGNNNNNTNMSLTYARISKARMANIST